MVRCSRWAHQYLTSVFNFYFARFVATWEWGNCQTVFVGVSSLNIFLLYMRLAFSIMIRSLCSFHFVKWLLRNIEPWKIIVLKSGRQQGQEAGVCWNSATMLPKALFVRKETDNQNIYTRMHEILAVSFILGISGFLTYFFSPGQVLEITICLCSCYSHFSQLYKYPNFDLYFLSSLMPYHHHFFV